MKKTISVLLCAVLLVSALATVVSAAPYATYTYSAQGQVLTSPAAYVPDAVVDSIYMGVTTANNPDNAIDDPRDLFVGPDLKVYIVDAAHNRVIVLDRYYKLLFMITTFTNEHGVPDSFNNPSGVFANEDNIYVCDTDNNRIIMFDTEGNYIKIIPKTAYEIGRAHV